MTADLTRIYRDRSAVFARYAPLVTLPRCLALALVVATGGCGGSTSKSPATTTVTVTTPTPTASVPRGEPSPPPDATTTTTTQSGDQQVRVPATYTVVNGRLQPATITVPPFLAVEISVTAADGKAHRLLVQTPTPHQLTVAAGGHKVIRIAGLRAGRYVVELDGKPAGALLVGGDAGP